MAVAAKLRRAPVRLAAGAFVLNSGLGKLKGGEAQAVGVHGMAAGAYPFLKRVEPKLFLKILGGTEVALGTALLLPILPAGLVGLGLSAFATGLLGMYARTPALHDEHYLPTPAGIAIAKDSWLAAIGYSLVIDAALSESKVTSTEPTD